MMKQIISCLFVILLTIETVYCLKSKLFRHKRSPDLVVSADDPLLTSQLGTAADFGTGISDTQMLVCKNRFDCEDFCRRVVSGQLSNSKSELASQLLTSVLTDARKLGVQLGRRNDCDKCGLIYANCDQRFMNFVTKFWTQTNTFLPKAKNDI